MLKRPSGAAPLVLLLLLALLVPISSAQSEVYRVVVEVYNNNDYPVDNYTLAISIPYDMIQDYITFLGGIENTSVYVTDSEGNPIYYYVERFDTSSLDLLVKIPYVDAYSSTIIYVYLANSNPYQEYHDKRKVYLFYDDFDDGVIDWNVGSAISSAQEVDGWLELTPTSDHTWNQLEYYKHYWINVTPFKPPFTIRVYQYVWYYSSYDLGQCFIALYTDSGDRVLSAGVNDWDGSYNTGANIYFWTPSGTKTLSVGNGIKHYIYIKCTSTECYFKSYNDYGTNLEATLSFGDYTIKYIAITSTRYSGYAYKIHKVDYIEIMRYADIPLSYSILGVEEAPAEEPVEQEEGTSSDISVNFTSINVTISFNFSNPFIVTTPEQVLEFKDLQWFAITFSKAICEGTVEIEFPDSGLDFTNTVYHGSANVPFPDLEGVLERIVRYANGTIDIVTSEWSVRIPNFTRKIVIGFPYYWDQSFNENLLELTILVQSGNDTYGIATEEAIVPITKFDVTIRYIDKNCIKSIMVGELNTTVVPRAIPSEYTIPDWYDIPGWFSLIQKLFTDFFGFVTTLFKSFFMFVLFVVSNPNVLLSYSQIFLMLAVISIVALTVYNPSLAFTVLLTIVDIAKTVFKLLFNAIMKVAQFIAELIPL